MDVRDLNSLDEWRQTLIPVVFRRAGSNPLWIRLPYAEDNRIWLKAKPRNRNPQWNAQGNYWELPKSRFDELIRRILERCEKVYVIQPYRAQERCAPACWKATGFDCECSCLGANHGQGHPCGNWFIVSETFAVSWKECDYACRLIIRNGQ